MCRVPLYPVLPGPLPGVIELGLIMKSPKEDDPGRGAVGARAAGAFTGRWRVRGMPLRPLLSVPGPGVCKDWPIAPRAATEEDDIGVQEICGDCVVTPCRWRCPEVQVSSGQPPQRLATRTNWVASC